MVDTEKIKDDLDEIDFYLSILQTFLCGYVSRCDRGE